MWNVKKYGDLRLAKDFASFGLNDQDFLLKKNGFLGEIQRERSQEIQSEGLKFGDALVSGEE